MLRDEHYRAIRETLGESGRVNGVIPTEWDNRRDRR